MHYNARENNNLANKTFTERTRLMIKKFLQCIIRFSSLHIYGVLLTQGEGKGGERYDQDIEEETFF